MVSGDMVNTRQDKAQKTRQGHSGPTKNKHTDGENILGQKRKHLGRGGDMDETGAGLGGSREPKEKATWHRGKGRKGQKNKAECDRLWLSYQNFALYCLFSRLLS